jgi:hypothetical protein
MNPKFTTSLKQMQDASDFKDGLKLEEKRICNAFFGWDHLSNHFANRITYLDELPGNTRKEGGSQPSKQLTRCIYLQVKLMSFLADRTNPRKIFSHSSGNFGRKWLGKEFSATPSGNSGRKWQGKEFSATPSGNSGRKWLGKEFSATTSGISPEIRLLNSKSACGFVNSRATTPRHRFRRLPLSDSIFSSQRTNPSLGFLIRSSACAS